MRLSAAVTATFLLLTGPVLAAHPASAVEPTPDGVRLEVTTPATIVTGRTALLQATVTNPGSSDRYVDLRFSFVQPVEGPVRRLDWSTTIQEPSGHHPKQTWDNGTLHATTGVRVPAGGSRSVELQTVIKPTSLGRIESSLVTLETVAQDHGTVVATAKPTAVTIVEPLAQLTDWPAEVKVNEPVTATATYTNTTAERLVITAPCFVMYRRSDNVTVEVRDTDTWRTLRKASSYAWCWDYLTLEPGQSRSYPLRVTFPAGESSPESTTAWAQWLTLQGDPMAIDMRGFTIQPA
jgi:hypothetical protein